MRTTTKKKKKPRTGVPIVAQWVKNQTKIHKDVGLIPGFAQWSFQRPII